MSDVASIDTIAKVAEIATKSQDPIISSILFVFMIVVVLLIFARPLMSLVKDAKGFSAAESKMQAEESLFNQLRTQVDANQIAIEKLNSEKDAWVERATKLEREVDRLKHFEQMVESMKKKLDEKDEIITRQNAENKQLMLEILQLKDRIHELELRLTRDEQMINTGKTNNGATK